MPRQHSELRKSCIHDREHFGGDAANAGSSSTSRMVAFVFRPTACARVSSARLPVAAFAAIRARSTLRLQRRMQMQAGCHHGGCGVRVKSSNDASYEANERAAGGWQIRWIGGRRVSFREAEVPARTEQGFTSLLVSSLRDSTGGHFSVSRVWFGSTRMRLVPAGAVRWKLVSGPSAKTLPSRVGLPLCMA